MNNDNILLRIQQIFRDVFDMPTLDITSNTSADDIGAWDSLNHMRLVIALELEFNLKFSSLDVAELTNVGDLVILIKSKLK